MSSVYQGTGNGIDASRADVTYYESTEVSTNTAIANLTSGMLSKWGDGIGNGVNLTFSVNLGDGNSYYVTDYPNAMYEVGVGLNLNQQNAVISVLIEYSNIANLSFSEVIDSSTEAGDLRWSNAASDDVQTAFGYAPSNHTVGGDMWFGTYYSDDYLTPEIGSYGYSTFLHELGHAMGLNHPHDTNATVAPINGQDQLKYSVMSYRDYAGDALDGYYTEYFPTTLMLNDIQALQWLYGANTSYHNANDTYSWAAGQVVYETIWDGGGIDTLSALTQTQGCVLNLNSGEWSQIGAAFNNGQAQVRDCLTIAYGSTIENATGSNYADTLIGNGAANTLVGAGGNDNLQGMAGNDTLKGGLGNDTLDGGTGIDQVNYSNASGSVTVSLGSNTSSGAEGSDSLVGIENITGSNYADNLTGNNGINNFWGLGGNDTLNGGLGNDILSGGLGNDVLEGGVGTDTASYSGASGAVTVDLAAGTATGADGVDTLLTIESIQGSAYHDTLKGAGAYNVLTGAQGNDTLDGGAGNDLLQGGKGNDSYIFTTGYAIDTIVENDSTAGNVDVVQFGASLTTSQLWFKHQSGNNNLEVGVIGTGARLVVKDWYVGNAYRVEQFKAAGETLLATDVEKLVSAMAAFTSRPSGGTSLTTAEHAALDSVIAANWN